MVVMFFFIFLPVSILLLSISSHNLPHPFFPLGFMYSVFNYRLLSVLKVDKWIKFHPLELNLKKNDCLFNGSQHLLTVPRLRM